MNILWSVNIIMPDIAKKLGLKSGHAISWVDAMSARLCKRNDVAIAIAGPANVPSLMKETVDGIVYYVFPKNTKDPWHDIIRDFGPDIIHAYGTEKPHNLSLVKQYKDVPIIVSLQGILSEYQRHYYAGIDFSEMIRFISLKSCLLKDGFFSGRRDFIRRAKQEREILCECRYVEGRSTWDRVSALNINPNLSYYYCPRMIRAPFFENNWDINSMEKHSVFVHQGNYPIKGLHYVFMAIHKLKYKYPDIKLYIAGSGYFYPQTFKQRILQPPYVKYLKSLMKRLDIESNIEFTGFLSANDLAKKISKVNVLVIPSSIENAPNSLAEAEIVGTPTIATFVGGNMDMLEHKKDGYLYCYNEPNMLAEYITCIFDSNELAISFSNSARTTARNRHNPEKLEKMLLDIYREIINNKYETY